MFAVSCEGLLRVLARESLQLSVSTEVLGEVDQSIMIAAEFFRWYCDVSFRCCLGDALEDESTGETTKLRGKVMDDIFPSRRRRDVVSFGTRRFY